MTLSYVPPYGEIIPLHALLGLELLEPGLYDHTKPGVDFRSLLNRANVILAVDVMSRKESLVYGRYVLEGLVYGRSVKEVVKAARVTDLRVLRISLDMDTDELRELLEIVRLMKGRHDYKGRWPRRRAASGGNAA